MRRAAHWLSVSVVVVSLLFMAAAVARMWGELPDGGIQPDYLRLGLASVALVALFVMDALGWYLILKVIGRPLPVGLSVRIWMFSSVTRYLPGGIWPYATRAGMARRHGVELAFGSLSLYLETLLLTASSLAVGLPALFAAAGLPVSPAIGLAFLAFCAVLMHPAVIALAARLPGRLGAAFASVTLPGGGYLVGLYLYYVVFWLLFGAAFVLFVNAFFPVPMGLWPYVGSSLALAFCVGFVVIIFPSGIGLRESLLFVLLVSILPAASSVVLAVGSRLWLTAGEALTLAVVLLWPVRKPVGQDRRERSGV